MKNQRGYIALISAIIISAVLLMIVFTTSFTNFFARFNILDSEYKKISVGLAEACMDTAILELAQDPDWQPAAGGMSVVVEGAKTCKICRVGENGLQRTIYTQAMYQKAYTNLVALVSPAGGTITIDSWQEAPDYDDNGGSQPCLLP